jgi:outer membrane protein assembly factor BamA
LQKPWSLWLDSSPHDERNNTRFTTLTQRLLLDAPPQVDQGLGLGTKSPLFNRMTADLTRFVQLRAPPAGSKNPPITLVAHARLGNTIGDLPTYDAFLLGGPYSVRGYNIGELAACRRFVEGAVEVRVPVKGKQLYAFAEAGSDLESSKEVAGNPTQYYRRVGRGSSIGGGVKFGALRAEAAKDNNKGKWNLFLAYGDRF